MLINFYLLTVMIIVTVLLNILTHSELLLMLVHKIEH